MAVPRSRVSNARKNKRRSHHAKVAKNTQSCKNCNNARLSHQICPHCGYYKNRVVHESPSS